MLLPRANARTNLKLSQYVAAHSCVARHQEILEEQKTDNHAKRLVCVPDDSLSSVVVPAPIAPRRSHMDQNSFKKAGPITCAMGRVHVYGAKCAYTVKRNTDDANGLSFLFSWKHRVGTLFCAMETRHVPSGVTHFTLTLSLHSRKVVTII